MINYPEPYSLFRKVNDRFTPSHEKRGRICLGTTFDKGRTNLLRMMPKILRPAIVMLFIAFGFQTAVALERFEHPLGHFETLSTTQGMIIAAPHGTYDVRTDALAKDVARMLGAGYVIARGFSEHASRINVNRPTEGAGRACEKERRTERADDVYRHYARLVNQNRQGKPLRLYVEVHGHTSLAFLNRLEIATTGITIEEARHLKEKFPVFLAQAKALHPDYPDLELRMEPVDKVFFGAGCNKKIGYISTGHMNRALHMEIPRSARAPETLGATAALVSAIVRATMNLAEPDFGPAKKQNPEAGEKSAGSPAR